MNKDAYFNPKNMNLKDVYFGSIDATDELDVVTDDDSSIFYETYYEAPGLSVEKFLNGQSFFVYGLKGTGKTSLLRFIMQTVVRNGSTKITPFLFRFKAQFPTDIYNEMRHSFLEGKKLEEGTVSEIYEEMDYEDVWTYIILRQICKIISENSECMFVRNDDLLSFIKFVDSVELGEKVSGILKFLPKINKGKVKISSSPTLELDFKFNEKSKNEIDFSRYTSTALELYGRCKPLKTNPLYFMFDEIDPRTGSHNLFHLDSILIRDLIITIRKINTIFPAETKSVFLVGAVRSEVLDNVKELGKEVYKRLEHFGFCMNWGDVGRIEIDHPLIKMICKKIAYSEYKAGLLSHTNVDTAYIWNKYFRDRNNRPMNPRSILDVSWLRPRDFVRLLKVCVAIDGTSSVVTESLVSRAQKRYSDASWNELSTHLSTITDVKAASVIEKTLIGFTREFSVDDYDRRIRETADKFRDGEVVRKKNRAADIIYKLYKTGAIGNVGRGRMRFVFRGDSEPNISGRFIIHKGLLSHFSISKGEGRSSSQDSRGSLGATNDPPKAPRSLSRNKSTKNRYIKRK